MGKYRKSKLVARSRTVVSKVISGDLKLTDDQWDQLLDDYALFIRKRLDSVDIPELVRTKHDGPWHRRTE